MLLTIVVILVILWLLGWLVFSLGAFIHILLVLALIALVWHLVAGRRRI